MLLMLYFQVAWKIIQKFVLGRHNISARNNPFIIEFHELVLIPYLQILKDTWSLEEIDRKSVV